MTSITPNPEAWNRFMTGLSNLVGDDFREATEHPGTCRCELCLKWWVTMGPDDYGRHGPFTEAEVLAGEDSDETVATYPAQQDALELKIKEDLDE